MPLDRISRQALFVNQYMNEELDYQNIVLKTVVRIYTLIYLNVLTILFLEILHALHEKLHQDGQHWEKNLVVYSSCILKYRTNTVPKTTIIWRKFCWLKTYHMIESRIKLKVCIFVIAFSRSSDFMGMLFKPCIHIYTSGLRYWDNNFHVYVIS